MFAPADTRDRWFRPPGPFLWRLGWPAPQIWRSKRIQSFTHFARLLLWQSCPRRLIHLAKVVPQVHGEKREKDAVDFHLRTAQEARRKSAPTGRDERRFAATGICDIDMDSRKIRCDRLGFLRAMLSRKRGLEGASFLDGSSMSPAAAVSQWFRASNECRKEERRFLMPVQPASTALKVDRNSTESRILRVGEPLRMRASSA